MTEAMKEDIDCNKGNTPPRCQFVRDNSLSIAQNTPRQNAGGFSPARSGAVCFIVKLYLSVKQKCMGSRLSSGKSPPQSKPWRFQMEAISEVTLRGSAPGLYVHWGV